MDVVLQPWQVMEVIAAADFFTIEVWGPRGLVTFCVFFLIELATRRIEIAGITRGGPRPVPTKNLVCRVNSRT